MFLLTTPSTLKNCCFHIHDENENTKKFQEVGTNLGGKKKKKNTMTNPSQLHSKCGYQT
jgi:hypothetical protein